MLSLHFTYRRVVSLFHFIVASSWRISTPNVSPTRSDARPTTNISVIHIYCQFVLHFVQSNLAVITYLL
jgi:hypothetical protein